MKLHIAKCDEHNIVYVYTNKKAMSKDCYKYKFTPQEPVEFNQRQMASILEAMQKISRVTGNTIDVIIGNTIGEKNVY